MIKGTKKILKFLCGRGIPKYLKQFIKYNYTVRFVRTNYKMQTYFTKRMSNFNDISESSDFVRHSTYSAKYVMTEEFLKILISSGLWCKVPRKN